MTTLLFLGFLVFLYWCFSTPPTPAHRSHTFHTTRNTDRYSTALHEAGHYVVAKHRHTRGLSAELHSDTSGTTWGTGYHNNALDKAVIAAAGTEATNRDRLFTTSTHGLDARLLREGCREAGITPTQARAIARKEINQHHQEIRSVAEHLYRHGRI